MKKESEGKVELKKLFKAAIPSLFFVSVLVFVKGAEIVLDTNFYGLGVYPLKARGLIGILTSPLVHSSWEHLYGNALPLIVLGTLLYYFHPKRTLEVILSLYLISGFWLWIFGRPTYHIGASGVVYALAAYHITYGFVIRNPQMLALAFLVILSYGSIVWYILPIKDGVSWEAHLCGALCGVVLAIYYGREQKKQELVVRGGINFSVDKEYGEKITFNYDYKPNNKNLK